MNAYLSNLEIVNPLSTFTDAQILRAELRHTFLWFLLECPESNQAQALERLDPLFRQAIGRTLSEILLSCSEKFGQ